MDSNKKIVERVRHILLVVENLGQQLQEARAWAALWKRAARRYRDALHYITGCTVPVSWMPLQEELEAKDAEIERLQFDFTEAMRQYNAQQKRAYDAEAEIERLRVVLEDIKRCTNDAVAFMKASAALDPADD